MFKIFMKLKLEFTHHIILSLNYSLINLRVHYLKIGIFMDHNITKIYIHLICQII